MENRFERNCGISLIIAAVLMTITMAMHPAGGSIEHLLKISPVIIVTHSIALASLPFALLGFWGLTKRLNDGSVLPVGAFITMSMGMVAVLCAAAANGLILPIFINHYKDATPEMISSIKPILSYNSALNHAFDYIYMGAACGSVLIWSMLILQTARLPKWLGWLGVMLALTLIISTIIGFVFTNLTGFRIFILGFVVWTVCTALLLMKGNAVRG